MTKPKDVLADLAATTDMVAARLASHLLRVAALPEGVADEVKASAAELEPYVPILEQIGADPDDPVPKPRDLPKTRMPAPTVAAVTMPDGEPFPVPRDRVGKEER